MNYLITSVLKYGIAWFQRQDQMLGPIIFNFNTENPETTVVSFAF